MTKAEPPSREPKSYLLEKLEKAGYARLLPFLESVRVGQSEVLCGTRDQIQYVYFPITALLSRVIYSREGGRIETGSTGWEGMTGAPLMLGHDASPFSLRLKSPARR